MAQQFYYDDVDNTIHSMLHPEGAIFEGFNRNLIVYKNLHLPNQRWEYHSVTKQWTNISSGRAIDIKDDHFHEHQNILTKDIDDTPGQKWDVTYCDGSHHH